MRKAGAACPVCASGPAHVHLDRDSHCSRESRATAAHMTYADSSLTWTRPGDPCPRVT